MLQRLRHKISANRLGGSSSPHSGSSVNTPSLDSPTTPFPHPSSPASAFDFALDCSSASYSPVSMTPAALAKPSPRSRVRRMGTQDLLLAVEPYEVEPNGGASMPLTPQATPPLPRTGDAELPVVVLQRMLHPFSPRELTGDSETDAQDQDDGAVHELGMSQLPSAIGLGLVLGVGAAEEPVRQQMLAVPDGAASRLPEGGELRVPSPVMPTSDSSMSVMSSKSEGDILALLDRSFPSPPARTALLNEINLDSLTSTTSSETTTLCSRTPSAASVRKELAPSIVLETAAKVTDEVQDVESPFPAPPSWTSVRLQLQEQEVGIASSERRTLASRRKRSVPMLLPAMPPPPSSPIPAVAGRTASRLVYLKDGQPSSPGASGLLSTPISARSVTPGDIGHSPRATPRSASLASPRTPNVSGRPSSVHSRGTSASGQQPVKPPLLQSFSSPAPDTKLRRLLDSYALPLRQPGHTPRDSLSVAASPGAKSSAACSAVSPKSTCSHPPEMVCFAGCSASAGQGLSFSTIAETVPLPPSPLPLPHRRSLRLSMRRPSASSLTSRIQSIYQTGTESKESSPATNTLRKKRSAGTLRSCKSTPTLAALVAQEADEAEARQRQAAFVAALGLPDVPLTPAETSLPDVPSRAESVKGSKLNSPTAKSFTVLRMKSLSRLAHHVRAATASVRSSAASIAPSSPRKSTRQLQPQQCDKQHERERTSEDSFGPAERAPSPEHGLPDDVARKLRDQAAAARILPKLPPTLFEPFVTDGRDFTVDMDLTDEQGSTVDEQISAADADDSEMEELADTSKDSDTSHTSPFDFELSFTTAPLDRSSPSGTPGPCGDNSADTSWSNPSGDEQGDDSFGVAPGSRRPQLKRQSRPDSFIRLPYEDEPIKPASDKPTLLLNNDRLVVAI